MRTPYWISIRSGDRVGLRVITSSLRITEYIRVKLSLKSKFDAEFENECSDWDSPCSESGISTGGPMKIQDSNFVSKRNMPDGCICQFDPEDLRFNRNTPFFQSTKHFCIRSVSIEFFSGHLQLYRKIGHF